MRIRYVPRMRPPLAKSRHPAPLRKPVHTWASKMATKQTIPCSSDDGYAGEALFKQSFVQARSKTTRTTTTMVAANALMMVMAAA